jgi:DNA-binding transcriptional ArsR family regulator
MKRITTKELLASSFLELSEKKFINKITIANIVENCELTQPTLSHHMYSSKGGNI